MKAFYQRFKLKYNIESDKKAIAIIVLFLLTICFSYYVSLNLLSEINISRETSPPWIFWPLCIVLTSFCQLVIWKFKAFYQRFKLKYNIDSDKDAIIIFLVFALTGSLSVKLARPILEMLGISKDTMSPWVFWPLRILIIFPIYQLLQICIGSSLGQYKFFIQFQKKMFKPFGRLFGFNPNKQA